MRAPALISQLPIGPVWIGDTPIVQDLLAQFTIRLACVRLQVTPTADNLVSDLRGGTVHHIDSAQSLDVDVVSNPLKAQLVGWSLPGCIGEGSTIIAGQG